MDDAAEIRRILRLRWLSCLNEFADVELQRRMWLDPANTNPHWSYVEIMCSYFDDMLMGRSYDALVAQGLVGTEEAAIVRPLHDLLDLHDAPGGDDWDAKRILADPAWLAICNLAKVTNLRLAGLLTEPAEREALLNPIEIGPAGRL